MFVLQVDGLDLRPPVIPKVGGQPQGGAPQGGGVNWGPQGGPAPGADHNAIAILTRDPVQNTITPPGDTETFVRSTSRIHNTVGMPAAYAFVNSERAARIGQNIVRLAQLLRITRTAGTAVTATQAAGAGTRIGGRVLPIAGAVLTAGEIAYDYHTASQMPSTPREVVNMALEGIELSPDQLAAGVTLEGIKNQITELASRDLNNAENAEALRTFLMDNVGLDRDHSNMLIDCIKGAPQRKEEAIREADTGLGYAVAGGLTALAVVGVAMWWNPVGWTIGAAAAIVCLGIGIGYTINWLRKVDFGGVFKALDKVPVIGHIGRGIHAVASGIGRGIGAAARWIGSWF